jgi:hypothetical protein
MVTSRAWSRVKNGQSTVMDYIKIAHKKSKIPPKNTKFPQILFSLKNSKNPLKRYKNDPLGFFTKKHKITRLILKKHL